MKRRYMILGMVVSGAALVGGCGDDEETAGSGGSSTSAGGTTTTTVTSVTTTSVGGAATTTTAVGGSTTTSAMGGGTTSAGGMGGGDVGGAGGAGGAVVAACGNGIMEAGEGCDDGNQSNNDSCPDDPTTGGNCQPASCTDGHAWTMDGGDETDADCGGATCLACPDALVINEFAITPTDGEMIEIYNPLDVPVTLEHVHIADYSDYYMIAQGMGMPGTTDFRAGFPTGSMIGPKQYMTISLRSATQFNATYGANPDWDFDAADAGAPAMVGDIGSNAGLTNSGEMSVLFFWNGHSDLVRDIDYTVWGNTNNAMDKSGVVAGAGTYAAETAVAGQTPMAAHALTETSSRCHLSEGLETQLASNGFSGADETSENVNQTFQVTVNPTPGAKNNCLMLSVGPGSINLTEVFSADMTVANTTAITTNLAAFTNSTGLARNPLDWQLYIIHQEAPANDQGATSDRHLGIIDASTAAITDIALLTDTIASIAFGADGTLYGVSGESATAETLYTIDLATGALTNVATLGAGSDGEALAFNPVDGLLYHFSGNGTEVFESIELVNFTVTDIPLSAATGEVLGSIWDAYDGMFWVQKATLLTVDTAGTVTDTTIDASSFFSKGLVLK